MPMRPLVLAALLPFSVAACASDAANAPFPQIVPVSEIQAQVATMPGEDGIDALAARAADLRARADKLRGTPVVDDETEGQMQDALTSS